MRRRTFLMGMAATVGGSVLAGVGTINYAYHIEPGWVEVSKVELRLPRLDSAFNGYRIVQLSDIHIDSTWMDEARLAHAVDTINEQKPDMVAITGDFISYIVPTTEPTFAQLKRLKAPDGIFAVMGNHDHWADVAWTRARAQEYSIRELNDSSHTIKRQNGQLHLLGIDDLWPAGGIAQPVWTHEARLTTLTTQLPKSGAAILLVHEPDFADVTAANGRIDLQLSGHTHGGQVRVPFKGAIKLPPLGRKYTAGLYQIQGLQHYTNRGLGMMSPQVRLNCRPEITVFELRAS